MSRKEGRKEVAAWYSWQGASLILPQVHAPPRDFAAASTAAHWALREINPQAPPADHRMGRRKPFIDKRTATTYSLTCEDRPQEQPTQQPDPYREHHHSPAPPGCIPWDRGTSGGGLSEHERQEVLELGLPDDGYNYLQHIRDPGRHISVTKDAGDDEKGAPGFDGARAFRPLHHLTTLSADVAPQCKIACHPGDAGPKVFLPAPYLEPPPEDLKLFDARGLPLREAASDQVGCRCGVLSTALALPVCHVTAHHCRAAGSASLLQQRDSLLEGD